MLGFLLGLFFAYFWYLYGENMDKAKQDSG